MNSYKSVLNAYWYSFMCQYNDNILELNYITKKSVVEQSISQFISQKRITRT